MKNVETLGTALSWGCFVVGEHGLWNKIKLYSKNWIFRLSNYHKTHTEQFLGGLDMVEGGIWGDRSHRLAENTSFR